MSVVPRPPYRDIARVPPRPSFRPGGIIMRGMKIASNLIPKHSVHRLAYYGGPEGNYSWCGLRFDKIFHTSRPDSCKNCQRALMSGTPWRRRT